MTRKLNFYKFITEIIAISACCENRIVPFARFSFIDKIVQLTIISSSQNNDDLIKFPGS